MIEVHLRAFPQAAAVLMMYVETAFTTARLQTAEQVGPLRAPGLPERGWRGDARDEADISMAMVARRASWKRERADTLDSQLTRAVRRENTRIHRVCDDPYKRFLTKWV